MPIRESSFGYWTSSGGFIYVAAGAAVGIGNIARLPYLTSQYGGSVFLLAYLVALLLISWPILVAELSVGRWSRADPVTALQRFTEASGAYRAWAWIGRAALLAGVMVLSYYSIIAGWSFAYTLRAAAGALSGAGEEVLLSTFYDLAQDPERSLAWHTLFMVMACIIVAHGALEGIERAARYLVPLALLLMTLVFLYASTARDLLGVLQDLLRPDFTRFGWRGALEAIHQAFFTMALGLGAMMVLGAYLPARAPLGRLAFIVILWETLFGLVGGFGLYVLVLGAGFDPAPGLRLLFQVLPRVLPPDLIGVIFNTLVYLVIFMVTLMAAVALMEPVTRYLMDRQRTTRVFAATTSAFAIWSLGLLSLLSFNALRELTLFGRTFFDWFQTLTALLLPTTALLLCVFMSRIIPRELSREAWGEQPGWLYDLWQGLMRYPARIALILLLLYVSGLLDHLVYLWS